MNQYLLIAAMIAFFPLGALTGLYKLVPVIKRQYIPHRGTSKGLWIIVDTAETNWQSTVKHELEHTRQAWMLCIIGHSLLYVMSKSYRFWAEAKAYAKSVKAGRDLEDCAGALAGKYKLGISQKEAADRIRRYL